MRRSLLVILLCLPTALAQGAPPHYHAEPQRQYQVTDIGEVSALPGPRGIAVNDHGQIAGEIQGRAFLWNNGKISYLGAFATGWGTTKAHRHLSLARMQSTIRTTWSAVRGDFSPL